jgi:chorismate--pyruvate lyase
MPGPFWARHYTFYVKGRPLTLIYEVFSNALEAYLGPSRAFLKN